MRRNSTECVREGAKLLDKHSPGWAKKIETARLDMSHSQICALGQLFGGYRRGLSVIGLTYEKGEEKGFSIDRENYTSKKVYTELNRLWRGEVKHRLTAA